MTSVVIALERVLRVCSESESGQEEMDKKMHDHRIVMILLICAGGREWCSQRCAVRKGNTVQSTA